MNRPMVFLSPDDHAYLVLGDGKEEPLITWSKSFEYAQQQADIHDAVVVAVPVVHDASWRRPHPDDPAPAAVPMRASSFPRLNAVTADDGVPAIRHVDQADWPTDGYPLGRARTAGDQGGPDDRWSSVRADVVGQQQRPGVPEPFERVAPFGDPAARQLPRDPEAAAFAAFAHLPSDVAVEAVTALRTAGVPDVGTLERLRDALRPPQSDDDSPTAVVQVLNRPAAELPRWEPVDRSRSSVVS